MLTCSEDDVLSVQSLTVNYGDVPVLWDINLCVPQGQMVAIIGPNGAGKSTLLKTVLGFLEPLSGSVRFHSKPLKQMLDKIAYVPQRESVDWDFPITVKELVMMGSYRKKSFFQRSSKKEWSQVMECLKSVQLESFAERQISQLSGGQQQRAFLARALMQDASVYFLDEPLAGVDMATEKLIIDLLKQKTKEGKTVFIVHHDLNSVVEYFNYCILLNMRLIAAGPIQSTFIPENLQKAYGKNYSLFDQAFKLSYEHKEGFVGDRT